MDEEIEKIVKKINGLPYSQAVRNPAPLSLGDEMISRDRVIGIVCHFLTTYGSEQYKKGVEEERARIVEWADIEDIVEYGMDTTYGDTKHPHPSVIYGRNEVRGELRDFLSDNNKEI